MLDADGRGVGAGDRLDPGYLRLRDGAVRRHDDPVGREVNLAREHALRAGVAALEHDSSPVAREVKREFTAHLGSVAGPGQSDARRSAHHDLHHRALQAARQAVLGMRANEEIGDDAFHRIEEELDWIEMSDGGKDGGETRDS